MLCGIGKNGYYRTIRIGAGLQWSERRHVLNEHEAHFIAGFVKQIGFDLDLLVHQLLFTT